MYRMFCLVSVSYINSGGNIQHVCHCAPQQRATTEEAFLVHPIIHNINLATTLALLHAGWSLTQGAALLQDTTSVCTAVGC